MIEDLVEVQAEEIPDIDESTLAKQLRLYHHTLERWKTQRTPKMFTKIMSGRLTKSTVTIIEEETPMSMCNGNKATEVGYP